MENKQTPAGNFPVMSQDSGEMEIDLLDLISYWRKHLTIILLVALIGGILGFSYTLFLVSPRYRATSSLYVVSASADSVLDLTDLNLGNSLSNDYVELVKSRTMMERVLAQTGDPLSSSELSKMLSVGHESGTRILTFTVSSESPQQAMRLANAFSDQAITYLPEVMGFRDNVPHEIDRAILPTAPFNMNYMKNIVIGLMAAAVLIVGLYTVKYLLNDTFDSADDVEKYLGISPLAVIPENNQYHRGGGYYYTDRKKGRR